MGSVIICIHQSGRRIGWWSAGLVSAACMCMCGWICVRSVCQSAQQAEELTVLLWSNNFIILSRLRVLKLFHLRTPCIPLKLFAYPSAILLPICVPHYHNLHTLCYNLHTLELFAHPLELFACPLGLKYSRFRNPDLDQTF